MKHITNETLSGFLSVDDNLIRYAANVTDFDFDDGIVEHTAMKTMTQSKLFSAFDCSS